MNISDDQTLVQPQYLQRQQLHPLKFWLTFSRVGSGCGHLKLKWRCLFWIPGPSIKKDLFWEHWRWISLDLLPTSSPGQIAWQLLAWVWSIHGWCFLTWNKTFKARRKSCQIAPGGVVTNELQTNEPKGTWECATLLWHSQEFHMNTRVLRWQVFTRGSTFASQVL